MQHQSTYDHTKTREQHMIHDKYVLMAFREVLEDKIKYHLSYNSKDEGTMFHYSGLQEALDLLDKHIEELK